MIRMSFDHNPLRTFPFRLILDSDEDAAHARLHPDFGDFSTNKMRSWLERYAGKSKQDWNMYTKKVGKMPTQRIIGFRDEDAAAFFRMKWDAWCGQPFEGA